MWWVVAYIVQVALVVALSIRDVLRPARALTWMVISLVFPGIGLIAYVLLTRPVPKRHSQQAQPHVDRAAQARTKQPRADRAGRAHSARFAQPQAEPSRSERTQRQAAPHPAAPAATLQRGLPAAMAAGMGRLMKHPPQPATVSLLDGGIATYDVLLTALAQAKHTIDVEYYIFRDDHIGRRVVDRLCKAAARGVRVRFMRDGVGSHALSGRRLQEMTAAGIACRVFAPMSWFRLRTLNHRDHCKIVVVDGVKALTGGINVGDEYTGVKQKVGRWRDADLLIEGEAVRQLADVFETNFAAAERDRKAYPRKAQRRKAYPRGQQPPRRAVRRTMAHRPAMVEASAELAAIDGMAPHLHPRKALVQAVESGPDSESGRTRMAFFLATTMAQHSICLTTPYFAPEVDLSMALCAAATRGVRVRLMVPKKPDHKLIGLASWTYFEPLVQAGVEIYLYEGAVLHAKLLTVDGEVSMVGAANCDIRSFRENYEISALVYDAGFANQLEAEFERDVRHCERLTSVQLRDRSFLDRTCQQGARLFASLL